MEFLIKYKKIFLIVGFVAIVFILGYFLYALFFKTTVPQEEEKEQTTATTTSGLPISLEGTGQIIDDTTQQLPAGASTIIENVDSIAQGGLTQTTELNQTPSIDATLSGDGLGMQYYNQQDGKFYKITNDGKISELSEKIFYDVSEITWAPDKEKAILEYPDGSNVVYNFETSKQVTLPKHWEDFNFSSNGDKIVMKSMGLDPDNRWLAISNEDGSKTQPIEPLGLKNDTVYPSWSPSNQIIAMYTEGIDFDRQEVFFVGLNDENFKSTIVEGRDFRPRWSPNGEQLLYSVYSNKNDLKPMLWVVDSIGDKIGSNRKKLNIETWSNKCVFSGNTELYCAVPRELEKGAGIFLDSEKNTSDILYKIDIKTGLKKLIAIPDKESNMTNLEVSEDKTYLYFTDEATKKINKIKLK